MNIGELVIYLKVEKRRLPTNSIYVCCSPLKLSNLFEGHFIACIFGVFELCIYNALR